MRKIKLASIIIILSMIVFQFQNCGSPPDGYSLEVASNSDSGAGLIDDLPNKKLTFVESLVVSMHDKNTINYDGLCSKDSNGADMEWVLEDMSNREVVLEGQSKCIRGGFRISINKMLDIECNVDYELIPFMGEFEDKVIVRRKCEPMASIKIEDENEIQQKLNNPNIAVKECFYELEEIVNTKQKNCYKTCYMSHKLYNRDVVDINLCLIE